MDDLTRERFGPVPWQEVPGAVEPWGAAEERRRGLGETLTDAVDRTRHVRLGAARRDRDRRLARAVRDWTGRVA